MATIKAYIFVVNNEVQEPDGPPIGPPLLTPADGDIGHAQAIIDNSEFEGLRVIDYVGEGKWAINAPELSVAQWDREIAKPGSGGGLMVGLGNGVMLGYDHLS